MEKKIIDDVEYRIPNEKEKEEHWKRENQLHLPSAIHSYSATPKSIPVKMSTSKQQKLVDLCGKYPGWTLEILMLQDLWNKKQIIAMIALFSTMNVGTDVLEVVKSEI